MEHIYYKIVSIENGKTKTLFHGVNGSRVLPSNEWITATKKIVSDGKGTKYLSGFHILDDRKKTEKYLERFKTTDDKIIIECYAKGIRPKKHSRDDVYLADKIFIKK